MLDSLLPYHLLYLTMPIYLEEPWWWAEGECNKRSLDRELFFPPLSSTKKVNAAKKVCRSCSVRRECFDWAVEMVCEDGIYGGFTYPERVLAVTMLSASGDDISHTPSTSPEHTSQSVQSNSSSYIPTPEPPPTLYEVRFVHRAKAVQGKYILVVEEERVPLPSSEVPSDN